MATNPDTPPSSGRPAPGTSWADRVRLARQAEPQVVDVRDRVRAELRRERAAAEDPWSVFAAIFAGPRVWIPGVACTLLAGPCALWLLAAEVGQMDAWARFLVIGGLPSWLVALVT